VARHSHASRCDIAVGHAGQTVTVTVEDDGIGLDGTATGLGRSSMIERAEELGGRCRVENRAGDGTRVQAALPADERRAGEPTREHRDRPG